MYNKNKKKFKSDRSKKKKGLSIEQLDFKGGIPEKEAVSTSSKLLEFSSFKDLQFKGAIEPRADVNAQMAKGSYPYRILNSTNRVVDATYPGIDNIMGNSLVQLQNSVNSQWMNLFDATTIVERINYLYLAFNSKQININYNIEMSKAFQQALSYAYSTMLTQLAFYVDRCESDLPRVGSLVGKSNDIYDRMGALLHYQTVQQNIITPMGKYVELMSCEQTLMNMSYRREAPYIQQIFGNLKKAAFKAQLNALGSTVLGEYLDLDWYKQVNALRHIPSRKADDMHNPLITMVTTHTIPHIKLYATATIKEGDTPYYDSAALLKVKKFKALNPETWVIEEFTELTLEQLVCNICKLLDPFYILKWTRAKLSGSLLATAITAPSTYYEQINVYLTAINSLAAIFSSNMTEVRTFLDKVSDSGLLYWKKGIKFDIGQATDVQLTYNQILADILKAKLTGSPAMQFDAETLRWEFFTPWDIYTGLAKYDKLTGGSFITFACREPSAKASDGSILDDESSARLVPIIFNPDSVYDNTSITPKGYKYTGVKVINRMGIFLNLFTKTLTADQIAIDPTLSRLNPLNKTGMNIKVPDWDVTKVDALKPSASQKAKLASAMHKYLNTVAGFDQLTITKTDEAVTTTSSCDPDLLCFIDGQIYDVSNSMIQFARNYSPFRVSTPDGARTIGFGSGSEKGPFNATRDE